MLIGISEVKKFALFVCFGAALTHGILAQTPAPKPPPVEPRERRMPRDFPDFPSERRGSSSEKALAVAPNVNIKLPCISQARVTVNGWQRDEIRVFIKNGSNVGFKVHEKDPKTGKPVWVLISGQGTGGPMSDCISGDRVDIEVPVGASLTITGRRSDTRVDSVKKIHLENAGGKVALRNISGGIFAKTFEGDVAVENSGGQVTLQTTTGNIIAYGVTPGQVGDVFKATTSNGRITLQNVDHRQIVANSVSGELLFSGKFLSGGIYAFKTSAGSIRLAIPQASSCRVVAWYGGSIDSEIPMKIITSDVSPAGKSLNALIGGGDATVNLSTNVGQILITKL